MPRRSHDYSTYSLVVCRQPSTGRWLAVEESARHDHLWWLPGGSVDPGERFFQAAHRECREEAGIEVSLLGILRVEHDPQGQWGYRQRVIFYAEPVDEAAALKTVGDEESASAAWKTTGELAELKAQARLRGDELLRWAVFLEQGGMLFPLSVFGAESEGPEQPEGASGGVGGGGGGGGGKGGSGAEAQAAVGAPGDMVSPPWSSATLATIGKVGP